MPRRVRAAVPLRVGLVAALLLLAACGLTASGIAVTEILRHSLIQRVDQTLEEGSRAAGRRHRRGPPGASRADPGASAVELLRAATSPWTGTHGRSSTTATPNPYCPTTTTSGREPTTVGSVDNSGVQWRAVSVRGPTRSVGHRRLRPFRHAGRRSGRWSGCNSVSAPRCWWFSGWRVVGRCTEACDR